MPRPDVWHRKFYVHPIQRKYLYLSLVPLIICSAAIMALAFVPMNLLLLGNAPEYDKAVAATCLTGLGSRIWPAIFITMLVVAGLSIFATHTLAGPLRRLENIGKRLAEGEFPETIRIRQGDDLGEIVGTLNEALDALRAALTRVRDESGAARDQLANLQGRLAAGEMSASSMSADLKEITAHLDDLRGTLQPYKL
ncbi:MAG TPA: methyl-accepting chemotaxis protein [Candidatus Acidoferrum sp.]|nr:methyl-accepting chemotaxis protein [Candidatus Acidoferrum sp.]